MSRYKTGDSVRIKQESHHYTGPYAGTVATIIKVDTDLHCTVEAFDGMKFMCPYEYISDDLPPIPTAIFSCECGAHSTYGKNCPAYYHADYCPLYRPRRDQ